ncbi:MAG: putative peptidoglycan binding domain protein [Polaromonas sp.]|nr:putative peptidoglycan binding domain protein [Polaromonas sp.]
MNPTQYPAYLARETAFVAALSPGAKGIAVRRVQEWLSHHGFQTVIDADYGPATARACQLFQAARGLPATGQVDEATWGALAAPLHAAVADVPGLGAGFDAACLQVARQHLAQHPMELGGENRGPWVRSYLNGKDGAQWLWCAGFVSFLMAQAAQQLGVARPLAGSSSCDTLSAQALAAGRFISGRQLASGQLPADALGSAFLFLVRRSPGDWVHTGLGFDLAGETFATVEGNTNDDGSRNGYEVCQRSRSVASKDFIVIA